MRVAGLHYQNVKKKLLKENEFISKSFKEQQKILFKNFYVYDNSFSEGMNYLGHDALEIVSDLEEMQKTWANENGCLYSNDSWRRDILFAQLQFYKPEIVYFQDIHHLSYEDFKSLKNRFPFIKLVVIFRGFPGVDTNLIKTLAAADLVFVGSPKLYHFLKDKNIKSHIIYHFFNLKILDYIDTENIEYKYDFTFIGSSGYGYGNNHLPRYCSLLELLNKTNIKLWIDEDISNEKSLKKIFTKLLIHKLKFPLNSFQKLLPIKLRDLLEDIKIKDSVYNYLNISTFKKTDLMSMRPLSKLFPDRCLEGLFGLDMYKKLSQSKLTFNIHTLPAKGHVDNMRLFQAAGMGSCLITDSGDNMGDLFEVDKEIVTYTTIDECIEKVNYLLSNESKRKEIAKNGQIRVIKDHSNMKRCEQMNEVFQKLI
jgi:hypothetical protein